MRQILEIGYDRYLIPEDANVGIFIDLFSRLSKVETEGYGDNEIFIPGKQGVLIQIRCVDDERVRQMTEDEKSEKNTKELKQSLGYKNNEIERLKKEVKEIKCVNAALCEQSGKEPGNEQEQEKETQG